LGIKILKRKEFIKLIYTGGSFASYFLSQSLAFAKPVYHPAIVWADVDLKKATLADDYFWEYLYSGIQDHKERHLKFRRPDTYKVLTQKNPPLADSYPEGGVANTPEKINSVYNTMKTMHLKGIRGEKIPYHWRW
jgi:hypothetical protein